MWRIGSVLKYSKVPKYYDRIVDMCVLFIFSLSLATSERTSHPRCSIKNCSSCKIDRKIPVSEQAWKFSKKLHHIYFLSFLQIFLKRFFIEHFLGPTQSLLLETPISEFFFLLTYLILIYWSFSLLCLCCCPTYQVTTIIQTYLLKPGLTWYYLKQPEGI